MPGRSNDIDESVLLEALRRGDDKAFEMMVREQSPRMLSVARRYLGEDDARDAVQEAFVSAFGSLNRFDGRARLSTWLHKIVVNASLMKLRKASYRHEESIEPLLPQFVEDGHRQNPGPAWPEATDALARRAEVKQRVREAIERLPQGHRAVLLLRDIEGMSGRETAEQLGITPGAAKVRLHRARMALRELLDPELLRSVAP